ncbi:hypothetical protein NE237_024151 [Protea cynaroides]|uniref:BHLH domain-containing protein n=1 Tax=Protea cynaroides TaxID=273540 RepID=A0A9Q0HHJ5_9MAGN|nr:hypothetical protein NE237_024151 [Protea cynaroides]
MTLWKNLALVEKHFSLNTFFFLRRNPVRRSRKKRKPIWCRSFHHDSIDGIFKSSHSQNIDFIVGIDIDIDLNQLPFSHRFDLFLWFRKQDEDVKGSSTNHLDQEETALMAMSSLRWVSDLGMEDPDFIHQCQMNSFDEFNSQHITAAFRDDFHSSFSSESYSSYPTLNQTSSTTTFSGSSLEASHRPTKQLKTNSWNSCTTTADPLSNPEASSSTPNILSFGGSDQSDQQLYGGNLFGPVKPKEEAMNFSSSDVLISQGSYMNQNHGAKAGQGIKRVQYPSSRSTSHTQEHVLAERKRREKLSERFIALSAIVPGLKKMDKASVLGDSIKYLKQLQERVKILEEQAMKKTVESVVLVKRSQISADNNSSSSGENFSSEDPLPEIEVRVSDKNVLIRIHCEKQKGVLMKILAEIEKLHLCVINSSSTSFGDTALDITIIAKMEEKFSMKVKDVVRHLRSAFRQFILQ